MTQYTRIQNKFSYHIEDLDCTLCLYKRRKSKYHKSGCKYEVCPFEDIRQDAIAHGRIKREQGWFNYRE